MERCKPQLVLLPLRGGLAVREFAIDALSTLLRMVLWTAAAVVIAWSTTVGVPPAAAVLPFVGFVLGVVVEFFSFIGRSL